MNNVIFSRSARDSVRSFVRNMIWSLSSRWGLHGLWPWSFEEDWLQIERREIRLRGLAEEFEGTTIAHVSDLHFCPIMHERHLRRFIRLVNEMDVDFVAITGDFITASARHYVRRAATMLGDLAPRVATVACLGNHDYGIWSPHMQRSIRGLGQYVAERLSAAGICVLRNESRAFFRGEAALHFAGVQDVWTEFYRPVEAMENIPRGEAAVTLVHNPDAAHDLVALGAEYILAGHTHGKTPRPTRLNNLMFPTQRRDLVGGEYKLGASCRIYVNRGIGSARRDVEERRPEIAVFTLRRAQRPVQKRSLPAADVIANEPACVGPFGDRSETEMSVAAR